MRPQKKTNRARHTHILETAEGGTCQDTEKNWPSEAHSLSGDGRGMGLSGHTKILAKRGTLTNWRQRREGLVRAQKETDGARRTHWLETAEGGTCQDTERDGRVRHTHFLETAEGWTCQDTERNRVSKAHSQTRDSRGRDLS